MLVVPHVSSREWCMVRILMKCAFLTIFITYLVTSYEFLFWLLGTLLKRSRKFQTVCCCQELTMVAVIGTSVDRELIAQ